MLSLREIASRYLGISGGVSVIRDIFGVAQIGGTESLRSRLEGLLDLRLDVDESIAVGGSISSQNGRVTLILQEDGNLVLYTSDGHALWSSHTWGKPVSHAIMQGDGNFVVYGPTGAVWATGTATPGSWLVVQNDGNVVLYAPDGRPLWATNTATVKVSFDPKEHGFHFPNKFVNRVATIPGYGDVPTRGRCGGMAYAALDYYFAGIPIPSYTGANFAPSRVPPDSHWLADYIYIRLMNSFFTPAASKFIEWTKQSDHETWFLKGVARWTKEEEFPKLRQRIDSGTPVALGLVGATQLANIGNKNHQVVAYGYDFAPDTGFMRVYVYDNNSPDQEVTLTSTPGNPHWDASNDYDIDDVPPPWRGFFVHDYSPAHPPVYTTAPPPPKLALKYEDTIKLGHLWTGRTLHSHALNYGHPHTSGQQQVTAFEGADDNDLWRVNGPDGQAEDYRAGQPVRHGDIVRLQHALTGKNLHSHGGFPSPVTGQQEVTCFGENGIGDGNDNWRVEVEGGGTWDAGKRMRLIHVNTDHALHSHEGFSHPEWTTGQQEVTCFGEKDDNDWWLLLEIH